MPGFTNFSSTLFRMGTYTSVPYVAMNRVPPAISARMNSLPAYAMPTWFLCKSPNGSRRRTWRSSTTSAWRWARLMNGVGPSLTFFAKPSKNS